MTTHAQGPDIVEEDHTEVAVRGMRRHQQRTHEHVGPSRFIDHRRPEWIKPAAQALNTLRQRTRSQIRPTGNNHAGGFAARVGIKNLDALADAHSGTIQSSRLIRRLARPGPTIGKLGTVGVLMRQQMSIRHDSTVGTADEAPVGPW